MDLTVYSKRVNESAVLDRVYAWMRDTSLSSVVSCGSWFSILSFHNDSYSEFYEKGSWHGADAFIITEVTIVNTPDIDYNDWTNGSVFITCKMTKCRQSILKIDLKTKSDLCAVWTKRLNVLSVFYSAWAFTSHCELYIAERARLCPSSLRKCHWETARSDWRPSEKQMTRVILQNDTWALPWHDDLRIEAFCVIL